MPPLRKARYPDTPVSKRGEELLVALEGIILSEGFTQLNVSDLAARLACSKRTLYELSASRNELVLRVLNRFFQRIRSDAREAIANCQDPQEKLYNYLQVGPRAAQRLSPAVVSDIQAWEPAAGIWRHHLALRVAGLRDLIEEGMAAGAFHGIRPQLVAEIVFAALNRLREPDFYRSTAMTPVEAFEEVYRMLLLALAPSGADNALGSGRETTLGRKPTQH